MNEGTEPNDETWHKVAGLDELDEGRVRTATVGRHSLALSHYQGQYGALDNRCPHQGGPLGEGSIENGLLRCPWHGYDYDPLTGQPPAGFSDAPACFDTEVREDGVYVQLPAEQPAERTVSDVLVETMVRWGSTPFSAWSDIPTLALPRQCAERSNVETSPISVSVTRAQRRLLRPLTANSQAVWRLASQLLDQAPPTC